MVKSLSDMRIMATLLCMIFSFCLAAQTRIIKGLVKNADTNEPVFQANIMANKGGVFTNKAGSFSLNIDDSTSKLYISYTGFQTDSVQLISSIDNYTIYLKQAFNSLDEVVV
jgi:hypothetical protein